MDYLDVYKSSSQWLSCSYQDFEEFMECEEAKSWTRPALKIFKGAKIKSHDSLTAENDNRVTTNQNRNSQEPQDTGQLKLF